LLNIRKINLGEPVFKKGQQVIVNNLYEMKFEGIVTLKKLRKDGKWICETSDGIITYIEEERMKSLEEYIKENRKKYGI